jgi:hypothetical protein
MWSLSVPRVSISTDISEPINSAAPRRPLEVVTDTVELAPRHPGELSPEPLKAFARALARELVRMETSGTDPETR